jgi:hypothetical protein
MEHPKRQRGTRVCLAVRKDGVTLYGNRAAFKSLAEWMQRIADSDPAEHYEFHVGWHLGSHFAKRPNVFVRFDRHMRQWFGKRGVANREKFELTLMQVENGDLMELERKPMLPEQPSA